MRIDSTHKRWFVATALLAAAALAGYLVLAYPAGGRLPGGSTVGLWYGAAGSALMAYAGLLSLHRRVPSWWWLGPRQTWLRGHIWVGLLSAVFLLCHSGFRWGGPLEVVLWLATIGVLATGVVGLVLQQILPRELAVRVPCEAPYEQIPHLCGVMRRKADALVDAVCGPYQPPPDLDTTVAAIQFVQDGRAQLRAFYEADVRPFLAPGPPRRSPLADPLQAEARFAKLRGLAGLAEVREQLGQLAELCEERRQMGEQERMHFWLHAWLLLHIPLAVALYVLGAVHAVWALYY